MMEVMLLGWAAGLKGPSAPQALDISSKATESAAVTAAMGRVALTIAVHLLQRVLIRKRLSARINLGRLLTVAIDVSADELPRFTHPHRWYLVAGMAAQRVAIVVRRGFGRGERRPSQGPGFGAGQTKDSPPRMM